MKILIGADHKGFELKEKIKQILENLRMEYEDLGNLEYDKNDDFPIFAAKVAGKIQEDRRLLGIVICGSGVGVDIVANRFKNVRSALAISPAQVTKAREHDNVNVLSLAADYIDETKIESFLKAFLFTPFAGEERQIRRLKQIEELNNVS